MENKSEKIFWTSVIVTFFIKVMLSIAIPITSDEAYFYIWGKYLDYGYYDHPPLIGWILHVISFFGSSAFLIRLPAVLSTLIIGISIYFMLKKFDKVKASLAASLFVISPINILNVLITTDTSLIICSFISILFLYKALKENKLYYYFFSGSFLGLAFLSKYFSVLLGLSYIIYFIFSEREKKKTEGFIILFLTVIPFIFINVYWNYTHNWDNIMFNVFNRNKKEEFSLLKPLIFILCQSYLITPPVLYYIIKKGLKRCANIKFPDQVRKLIVNDFLNLFDKRIKIFLFSFLIPLFILSVVSLKKIIGLHWVLSFYPFMYILVYFIFSKEELIKSIKFMLFFSIAHLFLIGTILSIPVKYFQSNKNYNMIIMGTQPGKIISRLSIYGNKFHFSTPSYADSALMFYNSGKYFSVFGGGSHHARQDDLLTNFEELDGSNILVLRTSKSENSYYADFFEKVDIDEFEIEGAKFYIVLGYNFKYKVYKERVLDDIKIKYYNIPSWLPVKH